MSEVESTLNDILYALPVPASDRGHRQRHFFTSTRNWAIRREKNEGRFETIATREGPADEEHERAVAGRMGLTVTLAVDDNPPLRQEGRRLIFTLRPERAADLAKQDAGEPARECLNFAAKCCYRLTVAAYREVYGCDPQWLADFTAARERRSGAAR